MRKVLYYLHLLVLVLVLAVLLARAYVFDCQDGISMFLRGYSGLLP